MKVPLSQQAEAISSFLGEPEWMLSKRLQAVQLLEKMKGSGEVEGFRMERGKAQIKAECEGPCKVLSFEETISAGNALKEQLERHFERQFPESYLLSFALFTDAAIAAFGKGKSKAKISCHGNPPEYFAWFFLVEDGAEAEVVLESTVSCSVSECRTFFIGDEAGLEFAALHNESGGCSIETADVYRLGKQSRAKIFDFDLGASEKQHQEAIFQEKQGSKCERYGLSVMAREQTLKKDLRISHLAKDTFSRANVKHICFGSSKSTLEGKVHIAQEAEGADASFVAKSLLASSEASCRLSPQIFVHNNQVNASHGSAVSTFDQEQLFYLQSRGLPEKEAKKMLIEGFGAEILGKASSFAFKHIEKMVYGKIAVACKEAEDG
ncbi:MAG: SufD family Fe-S cluster assembly protein [Candidatus Anstonellaceae archaeon]